MTTKAKLRFARKLRQQSTAAECKAWEFLRNRQMLGLKFKRQHPIRGFIVDFYCASLRLVLEIDGGMHDDPYQAAYDQNRTAILQAHGLTVLRIRNDDLSARQLRRLLSPLSRLAGEGNKE